MIIENGGGFDRSIGISTGKFGNIGLVISVADEETIDRIESCCIPLNQKEIPYSNTMKHSISPITLNEKNLK